MGRLEDDQIMRGIFTAEDEVQEVTATVAEIGIRVWQTHGYFVELATVGGHECFIHQGRLLWTKAVGTWASASAWQEGEIHG